MSGRGCQPAPAEDKAAGARAVQAEIAIVGMSCRFPGGADTPDLFWRNLVDGADAIAPVSDDRYPVGLTGSVTCKKFYAVKPLVPSPRGANPSCPVPSQA